MKTTTKLIKLFMTTLLAFISITVLLSYTAFAASVTFNVNVPSLSVGVGDTVEITVGIDSNEMNISSYSYEVHYDSSLLESISGGTKLEDGIISYSSNGESGSKNYIGTVWASCRCYRASSVHTSRTLSKIQVGLVSLFSRSARVASPERTQIVSTPALTPQAMSV